MTRKEAAERIKAILKECTADEDAVCYVTSDDADALDMAIKALKQEPCEDCISRQAAIDAICKEGTRLERNGTVAMCEIKQWCIDLLERLPSAQPDPHWIPCSERLPEEGNKSYWICTDGGYQCECRWTNVNHFWTNLTTDWHWHIMDVPQYSKVVAWMPLPEPYREGEQDE